MYTKTNSHSHPNKTQKQIQRQKMQINSYSTHMQTHWHILTDRPTLMQTKTHTYTHVPMVSSRLICCCLSWPSSPPSTCLSSRSEFSSFSVMLASPRSISTRAVPGSTPLKDIITCHGRRTLAQELTNWRSGEIYCLKRWGETRLK